MLSNVIVVLLQQNYGLGKQEDEWRGMQGMDVDREQGTVSHHPGWPGPPPGARPVPLPPGLHPPQPPQVQESVFDHLMETSQIAGCAPLLPSYHPTFGVNSSLSAKWG